VASGPLQQWFSTLNARRPTKDKYEHFGGPLSENFSVSIMHFMELKLTYFVFS